MPNPERRAEPSQPRDPTHPVEPPTQAGPAQPRDPTHPAQSSRAIRGHVVTLVADPFFEADALVEFPDGVVVVNAGIITAVGPYGDLRPRLAEDVHVDNYPGRIVTAGFVDAHVHYVQTGIMAAYGAQLVDWLNTYIFVEEQRFADRAHADAVAARFFDELLANGTTTALAFCAVYPGSVDAFFAEATRRNLRMAGGKVLMDRNAPAPLLDTAQSAYDDSAALIERWHCRGRNVYAVTPRFAPTSSRAQLEAAGALLAEHPTVLMHTHVSEHPREVAWVRSLFPDASGYLDVYDRAGLLRPGAVLAHGVHLTADERLRLHETGAAIAHCPTSNLFLGSGICRVQDLKDPAHPVKVGLGSDVGAGTSFSLLTTMGEAYKVGQLAGHSLDAARLLYLATLGGADAIGHGDRIGSIEVGKEADLVVLDPTATPLLAHRTARAASLDELLFVLAVMGDDRAVEATYVAGEVAHRRTQGF